MRNKVTTVALRTALLYAGVSALWILLSDRLLAALFSDPIIISQLSILKGWFFVGVTASLLYFELRRQLRRWEKEAASRERAEANLLQSQNRQLFLTFLIEKSEQPLAIGYADGRLGIVNRAFCDLVGYTASELQRLDWDKDLTPREWRAAESLALLRLKQNGHPVRYEKEYVRKNGSRVPVELLVHAGTDESGEKCFYGVITDISERKRAEKRLGLFAELGARLNTARTAKEAAEIIVDVADKLFGWDACKFTLCSRTDRMMTQLLTIDTVDGRHAEFPPEEQRVPPTPLVQEVIDHGAKLVLKDRLEPMPGTTPFGDCARPSASIMLAPIRHGSDLSGIAAIHSYEFKAYDQADLAVFQSLADYCGGALERIRAGEQLRKLSWAVEQSPALIVITDNAGNIEYVNPKFCQVTGYTPDEVRGKNPRVLKSGELPADEYRRLWQTITRGEEWRGEFHNRKKNGELFWESAAISAIVDEAGRITHYLAVKEDITERKRLEEQLRQSQKMDSIGQLAGGVAHDFNNLLTVIQGRIDLLEMKGPLTPEQRESSSEIKKATERAASLTRQLLLFSRRQTLQLADLDLNEIVTGITKMLRRIVGEDIQMQCHYAPRPLPLRADAGMLDQILLNLAVNSRDAMPRGGQLIIKTTDVTFTDATVAQSSGSRPGDFVCLSVSDTGCGIAPEILPRIFEPFFTTKDVGKGTGLGLATVFGIVQQHHGWINVESASGEGTTFHIHFPRLSNGVASGAEAIALASVRGGSETILLVEDDSSLRALARLVLTRLGYQVVEASSGREALDQPGWQAAEPELLLTDLVMPGGVSGLELAHTLLQRNPRLKVIYTSGYSPDIAGKDVALREGVNFLAKPFSPHKLAQAVRDCLDRQS